jgi:hypothetical protein
MWLARDRLGRAVVLAVLGQEVVIHLVPSKVGVSGETMPGTGTRRLVQSNYTSVVWGEPVLLDTCRLSQPVYVGSRDLLQESCSGCHQGDPDAGRRLV